MTEPPGTDNNATVEPTEAQKQPDAIRCHMQYRPVVGSADGELEQTMIVPRDDVLGLSSVDEELGNLRLRATYAGDVPDGAGVVLHVGSGDTHIWTGRYATPAAGDASGHGFTGLNYIEHDGAELQVWCVPSD